MKAMIMAAGVGSRLMPLTIDIPKPMIPMANQPLMKNIVNLLAEHGFNQLIANLHYHAPVIAGYFGNGSRAGVSMLYSREDELLGTAGGVKNCEWFLDDTFVVVSGDALTDVDLTALVKTHREKGALATIAVKEVEEVEHFGVVISDENGKIKRFQEKPRPEEALSHEANTGIYVFEPEVFKYIPTRQFYDFGKQVFPHLVKAAAPFYAVPIEDYWCDVGNIDTYRQAHCDILQGRVKVKVRGMRRDYPGARVLLGENTRIEEGVQFHGDVVVGADCHIKTGAVLENCVIWDQALIKEQAALRNCVLGSKSEVGYKSRVNSGAVIASHCVIGNNVEIPAGQKVFPHPDEGTKLEQG